MHSSHGFGFFDQSGGSVNLVPHLRCEVGVQGRRGVQRQGVVGVGQVQRVNGFVVGDKQGFVSVVPHGPQVVITQTVFGGPAAGEQTGKHPRGAVFEGPVPLAKTAIQLVVIGEHDGHIGQHQFTHRVVDFDDQNIELADVVHKALNFQVVDVAIGKVLAAHVKHVVYGDVGAGDHLFTDVECFVLLVVLAEFSGPAGLLPEVFGKGVDQTILVVDGDAIGPLWGQCINNEGLGRTGQHLFGDVNIGA